MSDGASDKFNMTALDNPSTLHLPTHSLVLPSFQQLIAAA
ncbi:hypothetical protein DEU53_10435 [Pantoea sp. AG1095]|nr:hypothetical protein DEU53_10435 [Pantoea sp. AG1095]